MTTKTETISPQTKTQKQEIQIVKRDGRTEALDIDKMHFVVEEACAGLTGVSASQIEMNADLQFTNMMTTQDIQDILIRSANDLISLCLLTCF